MKKNTKKQIPKVRLPKYKPGGIHEEGHEGSADQPAGSENFYNQGRTKKINNGQYAQMAMAAANTGAQLYANRSLTGDEKSTANAGAINSGVDSIAGSVTPWYQYAKGASDMGRGMIKRDDAGVPIDSKNKQLDAVMKPQHQMAIDDATKGNYGLAVSEMLLPGIGYESRSNALGLGKGINKLFGSDNSTNYKFAMGGMQYAMGGMKPNAEVEDNEMITSNVKPQVLANGGVELASNNPYSAPTYKTNGATHEDGGIPVNMQPGSIINGKTKVPAFMANKKGETFAEYMKKLANEENSVVKLKDNILKKAEKGDKYSKNSSDLLSLVLDKKLQSFAELKNKANNIQNAIIANKEQLKAIRKGELPSMDNEQAEPQGMSEASEGEVATAKYGGMYAKGGIHINPANKGKFTASAQRAGMGTQEFARHVLANKEDYSSTQVKRANFAHNAAGWKHEMGGIQQYEMGGESEYGGPNDPKPFNVKDPIVKAAIARNLTENPLVRDYSYELKTGGKKGDELFATDSSGKKTKINFQDLNTGEYNPAYNDTVRAAIKIKMKQDALNSVQKHAMGGVQLPYYNTNNDNTPKYAMGGFNNDTLFNNAGDPPTKITGGYGDKPTGPTDNRFYWTNGTQVKNPELRSAEYKGLGTGMTIDQSNQINKARGEALNKQFGTTPQNLPKFEYLNDPSKGSYDQQFNEYKKVYLPGFKYGGNMPKFDEGGTFVNGVFVPYKSSYKPGTLGYNDSMNSPENPSNDSLQSSYRPDVLPWNRTNDSNQGPNGQAEKSNFAPQTQQFQDATKSSNNNVLNTSEPPPNKINWSNVGTNVAMGLANNAGNIADLARYNKPEVEKYQRMVASLVDSSAAMRDAEQEARRAESGIKNASTGNAATYLANRIGLNASNIMNKDRIRQQYANINAGINNSTAQYNNELARQEVIANAQNRAAARSGKNAAIGSIGSNVANQIMDNKKGGMDQETLALMVKYYNDPQFKKYIEESKFNKRKSNKKSQG